jgi:hypothetical protein
MALADQLRDCIGMWVAVKGDSVLCVAATPGEIVQWLRENTLNADSCFRVPEVNGDHQMDL